MLTRNHFKADYREDKEAQEAPIPPPVEEPTSSHDEQVARGIRAILDLPVDRVGFYGLAFKENTDDLRESPVITVLEALIGKGRNLRVFDPHIQLGEIYGSNQRFLLTAIPHISKLMDSNLDDMLAWAEHVVLMQKPTPEAMQKIRAAGVPVLDMVGGKLVSAEVAASSRS